ncbi:conjugal transfer protein [Yoonia sp. R2-816]|uniref:conjugal transfer protein n=1 Tax=Yoonia sp. R2-816 TaxID=3342638 RepID=UPI00372672E8
MNPLRKHTDIPGYFALVHRALIDPILLACVPRTIAIANSTLAATISLSLRLWIVGLLFMLIGHLLAIWAAKRDVQIADVARRHLRYPS